MVVGARHKVNWAADARMLGNHDSTGSFILTVSRESLPQPYITQLTEVEKFW